MSQKEFWLAALKRLSPTIKKSNFITWFQNTAVLERSDQIVTVGVPTEFARNWIMDKYRIKILQAFQELDPKICSVEFRVKDPGENALDVNTIFIQEEKKVRKVRNHNAVNVSKGGQKIYSEAFNDRYTLKSFVVGRENQLPHAASAAVANAPGGIYNPLYIYGSVGLGKTHLMNAIGNEILKTFPDKVVKYVTAEKFVTEVVQCIAKRNMAKFKDFYRNVDVLLVDDVQFFARKDSSQQEFFHTFNELYNNNKQIVITSDRAPSELDNLDERLKSRFGMGMVVELLMPDFETRLAILQQKSQEFGVLFDPQVLEFIANNVHNSVRELEGVLRQAIAESELTNRVTTIRSVAEIIKRMNKAQQIIGYDIEEKKKQNLVRTVEGVIEVVADFYDLTTEDLTGKNRRKEVMWPRQVCMYLIKNELGESYERIGNGLGGRTHTTVMHACTKTRERLKKDVRLVRDINAIKREMGL